MVYGTQIRLEISLMENYAKFIQIGNVPLTDVFDRISVLDCEEPFPPVGYVA